MIKTCNKLIITLIKLTKKDFRSPRRSHFVGLDGRFLHFRRNPWSRLNLPRRPRRVTDARRPKVPKCGLFGTNHDHIFPAFAFFITFHVTEPDTSTSISITFRVHFQHVAQLDIFMIEIRRKCDLILFLVIINRNVTQNWLHVYTLNVYSYNSAW